MYGHLPPDPGNRRYWEQEGKRRGDLARSGGLTFELIRMVWFLVKGLVWLVILPLRLSYSWWQKRRQNKTQDPFDWLNKN